MQNAHASLQAHSQALDMRGCGHELPVMATIRHHTICMDPTSQIPLANYAMSAALAMRVRRPGSNNPQQWHQWRRYSVVIGRISWAVSLPAALGQRRELLVPSQWRELLAALLVPGQWRELLAAELSSAYAQSGFLTACHFGVQCLRRFTVGSIRAVERHLHHEDSTGVPGGFVNMMFSCLPTAQLSS